MGDGLKTNIAFRTVSGPTDTQTRFSSTVDKMPRKTRVSSHFLNWTLNVQMILHHVKNTGSITKKQASPRHQINALIAASKDVFSSATIHLFRDVAPSANDGHYQAAELLSNDWCDHFMKLVCFVVPIFTWSTHGFRLAWMFLVTNVEMVTEQMKEYKNHCRRFGRAKAN